MRHVRWLIRPTFAEEVLDHLRLSLRLSGHRQLYDLDTGLTVWALLHKKSLELYVNDKGWSLTLKAGRRESTRDGLLQPTESETVLAVITAIEAAHMELS